MLRAGVDGVREKLRAINAVHARAHIRCEDDSKTHMHAGWPVACARVRVRARV